MKRFFLAALLLFAAVAFTGCDNDDDDLYDTLSGTPTTTKSTSATGGPITRANCATYTSAGAG